MTYDVEEVIDVVEAEMESVESTDSVGEREVAAAGENDHEEGACPVSAEHEKGHVYEIVHLVGDEIEIEKETFELLGSGCVDACECGGHHGSACGTRRNGVGRIRLGPSCVGGPCAGLHLGRPWLDLAKTMQWCQSSSEHSLCSTQYPRSPGVRVCSHS